MYKLKFQMLGNEHGQLSKDTIYAKLFDEDGIIIVSADLEYVLAAIRDRGYEVEGVSVDYSKSRGKVCSSVTLDYYS